MKNQYLFPTILLCVALVISSLILSRGLSSFGESFERGMSYFSRSIEEGGNDVKLGLMNSGSKVSIPSNIRFGIYNQGKPFEFKALDPEAIETNK